MEIPVLSMSLPISKFPTTFRSRTSLIGPTSTNISIVVKKKLHGVKTRPRPNQKHGIVYSASEAPNTPPAITTTTDRWLLEPVGDGDSRHLGYKVAIPGAYEITSNEVIVGRLPDEADLVIPVSTVSGRHARIRNEGENLVVTDLESTNGTFIDENRLKPGVASIVTPGSCVNFGDIHLATFRVSKLKAIGEAQSNLEGSTEPDSPSE